jgi:hypothetical protein
MLSGRSRPAKSIRWLIVLAILIGAGGSLTVEGQEASGTPLYPDIRTAKPSGLYVEAPNGEHAHYVLRFDNTIGNWGSGRLELEAIANPDNTKTIYQNIFDAPTDGNLVAHIQVNSDFIYHPTHHHFHFSGFASYELLKRDSKGAYRPTTKKGNKTSFCIIDSIPVSYLGSTYTGFHGSYAFCDAHLQGLSAGWADVYTAVLPDQWVNLGTTPLENGQYAILSVADPMNHLKETNEQNNAAEAFFTMTNGHITLTSAPPHCLVTPAFATVDQTLVINCSGFNNGEKVDLYWGSVNTTPKLTVTATSTGAVTGSFKVPEAGSGIHYVIGTGQTSHKVAYGAMQVIPRISIIPNIGKVGSTVTVTAHGYAAGETVRFSFYKSATVGTLMASAPADKYGRAAASFVVPASELGGHKIAGRGAISGLTASRTYTVQPSLLLIPHTGKPGATISVSLRGFKAGEVVAITLEGRSTPVKTITVSSTGSASATSSNSFKIPTSYSPDDYQVTATGQTSGVSAFRMLSVLLPTGAKAPSPTPTSTPEVKVTATETPSATASPEGTETPAVTETATLTAIPTETETTVATATEVATETPTSSPTETPTIPPTETPILTPAPTETPP